MNNLVSHLYIPLHLIFKSQQVYFCFVCLNSFTSKFRIQKQFQSSSSELSLLGSIKTCVFINGKCVSIYITFFSKIRTLMCRIITKQIDSLVRIILQVINTHNIFLLKPYNHTAIYNSLIEFLLIRKSPD